jgi:hypothetical protein
MPYYAQALKGRYIHSKAVMPLALDRRFSAVGNIVWLIDGYYSIVPMGFTVSLRWVLQHRSDGFYRIVPMGITASFRWVLQHRSDGFYRIVPMGFTVSFRHGIPHL